MYKLLQRSLLRSLFSKTAKEMRGIAGKNVLNSFPFTKRFTLTYTKLKKVVWFAIYLQKTAESESREWGKSFKYQKLIISVLKNSLYLEQDHVFRSSWPSTIKWNWEKSKKLNIYRCGFQCGKNFFRVGPLTAVTFFHTQ